MIKIELEPLRGISIEGVGEVLLGQSRQDVEKLLGRPPKQYNTYSNNSALYNYYEFRLDFDASNKLEYIEFIYGPFPQRTELSILNVNPFTVGAEKLVEILSENNNGEVDLSEAEFSYSFLNSSVGVWRQYPQKDVEENISKLKLSGEYELNKSSFDDDLENSKNFWTIGIGVADYYYR